MANPLEQQGIGAVGKNPDLGLEAATFGGEVAPEVQGRHLSAPAVHQEREWSRRGIGYEEGAAPSHRNPVPSAEQALQHLSADARTGRRRQLHHLEAVRTGGTQAAVHGAGYGHHGVPGVLDGTLLRMEAAETEGVSHIGRTFHKRQLLLQCVALGMHFKQVPRPLGPSRGRLLGR